MMKTINTNTSLWGPKFVPVHQHKSRATESDQLVTCRIDGRDSKIGGKVLQNKTTEMRNRRGAPLENP